MLRCKKLAFVSNLFVAVAALVFIGLTDQARAACPEGAIVCVNSPNSSSLWKTGEAHPVDLTINTDEASQYRLYLKCGQDVWSANNVITLRTCDYFGSCPDYIWMAPPVTGRYIILPCQIAARLLDKNFKVIGTGVSDIFGLQPPDGHDAFYIDPLGVTVASGPSGSTTFNIHDGTSNDNAPYWVATMRNMPVTPGVFQLQENYDITTINLSPSRLKVSSSPWTFTVENTGSCTQVVILVQDSKRNRTTALYNIACP